MLLVFTNFGVQKVHVSLSVPRIIYDFEYAYSTLFLFHMIPVPVGLYLFIHSNIKLYNKVTGINLVHSLQEMLCRYGASLVQLAREFPKKRPDLLTTALEAVDRAKTEETRNAFCGTWYLPHSHIHNERTVPIIMAGCTMHYEMRP